ncbi:hypothetical protein [Psychroserpens luteus]|uniref:hypothetical protein n=1 Tax=Psychroserpens luteus TaxID=1434066 RepID=UPI001889DE6E|nr:hypothetical protein [Psychroserpens luteus]
MTSDGETYHTLEIWKKETFVWEQIWSRKRDWTKKELEHSLRYVNSVREKAGIETIKVKL